MCQYWMGHKPSQNPGLKRGGATYALVKVLDPHVSDNPMLSVPSLPKESETHPFANES